MRTIQIKNSSGKYISIPEDSFQQAILEYLNDFYPDRVKIISVKLPSDQGGEIIPRAMMMLAKNPQVASLYIDDFINYEQ